MVKIKPKPRIQPEEAEYGADQEEVVVGEDPVGEEQQHHKDVERDPEPPDDHGEGIWGVIG